MLWPDVASPRCCAERRAEFEGFLSQGVLGEGTLLQLRDEALEGPLSSAVHPLAVSPQWGPRKGGTSG